jgi:serine/threonine protein kinase
MAAVYLGQHITLQRPMAVKILHDHLADDPELLARFKAEAQSVAALRHPNIVQVVDFDVFEGRPYFVMEFVRGVTLAKFLTDLHLRRKRLRPETITRLITPLASALEYAHARGIIHRDIKPANIMLRQGSQQILPGQPIPPDVEPILTDFGVARIRDATTHTATGTILGTPAYMSPEQVGGKPIDNRSDIYSLGIILYEMLAGQPPFTSENDTPVSILMKHLDEPHPPLPPVHSSVQVIMDKALAKDPDERYAKAGDLADELRSITDPDATGSLPQPIIPEKPIPTPERPDDGDLTAPQEPFRSRTILYSALATVGLIAIVGILFLSGVPQNLFSQAAQAPTEISAQATATSVELSTSTPSSATVEPTQLQPITEPLDLSGGISFLDDHFQANIDGLTPLPEGQTYQVWLVGKDEGGLDTFLNLGDSAELVFTDGSLNVDFNEPDGKNLISIYHTFIVSREAISGEITRPSQEVVRILVNPGTNARASLVDEVQRGDPISENLPDWLTRQTQHLSSHISNALNSIQSNSLSGAKLHSEHVINIIEGKQGELFLDWDDNGRAENPGDDVGLLNYLRLLNDFATNIADPVEEESGALGAAVASEAERLTRLILDIRETARQIVLADSIDLIVELGLNQEFEQTLTLRDEIDALSGQARGLDLLYYLQVTTVPNP